MSGSINKVQLLGYVGQSPEIRKMSNDKRVCNLTLATTESWTDKATGEKREETEWHRIVVFNEGLIGIIERYVNKGSRLLIEGALKTKKWTDKDDNERSSTEIVLQGFNSNLIMLDGAKPEA